jgi:iron-sulfur cluster assembly protein
MNAINTPQVLITALALKAIDIFLSKRNTFKVLRLGVRGGCGCNGFKHFIECAETVSPSKDIQFLYGDISIVIDKKSMPIINNSILYWTETSVEKGLQFYNPNITSKCKCGKSFSV